LGWGANLSWSAFETGKMRYWVLLGLAVGVFLAKFINPFSGLGLRCSSAVEAHRHFFQRKSLAMLCGLESLLFPYFGGM